MPSLLPLPDRNAMMSGMTAIRKPMMTKVSTMIPPLKNPLSPLRKARAKARPRATLAKERETGRRVPPFPLLHPRTKGQIIIDPVSTGRRGPAVLVTSVGASTSAPPLPQARVHFGLQFNPSPKHDLEPSPPLRMIPSGGRTMTLRKNHILLPLLCLPWPHIPTQFGFIIMLM